MVIAPADRTLYDAAVVGLTVAPPVDGGPTRQRSVLNGLEALAGNPPDVVLIHDAARPFVDQRTLTRTLATLDDPAVDGAVAGVRVADTLKRVEADGRVAATVDRAGLWRAQTPQVFRFDRLLAAHRAVASLAQDEATALTDDVAVAEQAGLAVRMVEGHVDNDKITTAEDLERAAARMSRRETRTGTGFDVHAFGQGASVTLGGVPIPHDQGLVGHSDADVALHALTDALLGAIAAGDIGQHFPPSDPRWRGAASDGFVRHAMDLVRAAGGRIVNVDLTIICERPRIGPHRDRIQARIADVLGVAPGRVGIKATTTERLGFTGRGEGIAVQATASVELPARDH